MSLASYLKDDAKSFFGSTAPADQNKQFWLLAMIWFFLIRLCNFIFGYGLSLYRFRADLKEAVSSRQCVRDGTKVPRVRVAGYDERETLADWWALIDHGDVYGLIEAWIVVVDIGHSEVDVDRAGESRISGVADHNGEVDPGDVLSVYDLADGNHTWTK